MSGGEDLVIMQIVGLANGGPHHLEGRYVVAYDPTMHGDSYLLDTTPDIAAALRLTFLDAFELWRAVSPNVPVREDGRPNRPLTAFSIQLIRAPA